MVVFPRTDEIDMVVQSMNYTRPTNSPIVNSSVSQTVAHWKVAMMTTTTTTVISRLSASVA